MCGHCDHRSYPHHGELPPQLNYLYLEMIYEDDPLAMELIQTYRLFEEGQYADLYHLHEDLRRELEAQRRVTMSWSDAAHERGRRVEFLTEHHTDHERKLLSRIHHLEEELVAERAKWKGVTQVVKHGRVIRGRVEGRPVKRYRHPPPDVPRA